jgi:hypothetical protein
MQPFPRLAAFAVLAGVAGCTVTSTDPTKVALPQGSNKAVVLIEADPTRIGYVLQVSRYDPSKRSLDSSQFEGRALFQVDPSATPTYLAATLDPGTYVFADLIQQGFWAVCFQDRTLGFTLQPGDVVFLGNFHPGLHLAQLEQLAVQNRQTQTNTAVHYFDHIVPPQISRPTANSADFLMAKKYEDTSMPALHGRLQPVTYTQANFGIGYALTGDRICGGYFEKEAKPLSESAQQAVYNPPSGPSAPLNINVSNAFIALGKPPAADGQDAKAAGDFLVNANGIKGLFENVTTGTATLVRHKASGLVCINPQVVLTPKAPAAAFDPGRQAGCISRESGVQNNLIVIPDSTSLPAGEALAALMHREQGLQPALRPANAGTASSRPGYASGSLASAEGSPARYMRFAVATVKGWVILDETSGSQDQAADCDRVADAGLTRAIADIHEPAP